MLALLSGLVIFAIELVAGIALALVANHRVREAAGAIGDEDSPAP